MRIAMAKIMLRFKHTISVNLSAVEFTLHWAGKSLIARMHLSCDPTLIPIYRQCNLFGSIFETKISMWFNRLLGNLVHNRKPTRKGEC